MSFDIFRVDWILIDSIISIILIIFLIGVSILKRVYRWRFPLSNKNLGRLISKTPIFDNVNLSRMIKKWSLIYPKNNTHSKSLLTIFILRKYRKFMLLNALAEGLSTYGFNIVNLWVKNPKKMLQIEEMRMNFYSEIINHFNENDFNLNKSYSILASGKVLFGNENGFLDSNNKSVIILNPVMNDEDLLKMSKISLLYGILSEKFIFFFRNPNLKRIIQLNKGISSENFKIRIIKGAKRSFKYYETILLGDIIKIIDKKLI